MNCQNEEREIYLDHSATTRVCSSAAEAVLRAMQIDYGNAASLHRKGFEAEQLLIDAKKCMATVLGCQEGEIYFTSGATESNNLALIGAAQAAKRRGKKIVTTAIEHPSVLETMNYLETQGFEIVTLSPGPDGSYRPADFADVVDDQTVLVSAMFVNNETGLILPILEIAKAVKRKNPQVLFHTDAVQGFLKLPLRLKNSSIDLLSASGHKVYAPKGIGLLYLKKGVRIQPLFYGGGQQNGIRVGTDSVAMIAGFAAAVRENQYKIEQNLSHYRALKAYLLSLLQEIPEVTVNSLPDAAPFVVNLSVSKIRSEIMLHFLEQFQIYVSSGSACSKGANSHVLEALGLDRSRIDTALRISFSPDTEREMLDIFVSRLREGISSLAKMKS